MENLPSPNTPNVISNIHFMTRELDIISEVIFFNF